MTTKKNNGSLAPTAEDQGQAEIPNPHNVGFKTEAEEIQDGDKQHVRITVTGLESDGESGN